MQVNNICAYFLPHGGYVEVRSGFNVVKEEKWLDIAIKNPNGSETLLCAIDFCPEKGLQTIVFENNGAEPVFTQYHGFGPSDKE